MRRPFAGLVVLLAGPGFAQDATGRLSGLVHRDGSQAPLSGVTITLSKLEGAEWREQSHRATAKDGSFAFDGMSTGRYSLRAQRPGFLEATMRTVPASRRPLFIDKPDGNFSVDVSLVRFGEIAGRVADENGDGITKVSIEAISIGPSIEKGQEHYFARAVASTLTLVDGKFSIDPLPPGRYVLSATTYSGTPWTSAFYPDGHSLLEGTVFELKAGQSVRGITFKLPREPAYCVKGRVLLPLDEARAKEFSGLVMASLYGGSGLILANKATAWLRGPDAAFRLCGLPTGNYRFNILSALRVSGNTSVTVNNENVSGVQIRGYLPIKVEAILESDDASLKIRAAQVSATLINLNEFATSVRLQEVTGSEEKLVFDGVIPGLNRVAVHLPQGICLKSGTTYQLDEAHRQFKLVAGRCTAHLQVSVEGAEPDEPVEVVAVPLGDDAGWARFTVRGMLEEGSATASLTDIAPGRYSVFALPYQAGVSENRIPDPTLGGVIVDLAAQSTKEIKVQIARQF